MAFGDAILIVRWSVFGRKNSILHVQHITLKNIDREVIFMLSRDALKEFLVECHLRQLSDRTIKHERNSNNALLTFLEREYQITQIEEIRHVHLKGYIQYLIKLQRKETYINGLIKSFVHFLSIVLMKNILV